MIQLCTVLPCDSVFLAESSVWPHSLFPVVHFAHISQHPVQSIWTETSRVQLIAVCRSSSADKRVIKSSLLLGDPSKHVKVRSDATGGFIVTLGRRYMKIPSDSYAHSHDMWRRESTTRWVDEQ